MQIEAHFPPTRHGLICAVATLVPHVRSVSLSSTPFAPGLIRANVRLRWYAWLTLGVLHAVTYLRARRVLERCKALGCTIEVRAW